MAFITKKAAIVGVYDHPERRAPYKTPLQIHMECAKHALADAGLTKEDVDAYFTSGVGGMPPVVMAEYLGIHPTYVDSTSIGGASFVSHLGHAAAAIAAGMCQVALITYGSTSWSQGAAIGTGGRTFSEAPDHFEAPFGPTLIANYALAARRHMHQYGTTPEQLAEIAVATRKWAAMNPNALMRSPISIQDVVNSRMIADPLHLLDCCVITDGGGAVVVASAERARDGKKPPVWVLGAGEAVSHSIMSQMHDLTVIPAKWSGEKAFTMAGLTPQEMDLAMTYDSFTITALLALEALGFCKPGEGGDFVSGQRTAPGGALPMNTDGGALSNTNPGMRGIFLLIEATRQLRGERGEAQVPNCKLAVCHGTGGMLSSGATAILGRD